MSFLRNIRNSISRGNSSTRDTTPNSRRSSSVDSAANRCDSLESKPPTDGLQRSETFTLDEEETLAAAAAAAAKVKSSKKEKVLSKFSTFTKRKKSPAPCVEEVQKTTYYKWRSGIVADPVQAAMDPFNFLYEQPSSLKSDLSGHSDNVSRKVTPPTDYSTYRKNRVPSHLREKLDQLKNHPEISEEIENDPDKFRTITINSFRKSFRDKFLASQNEVPHNPSWFVEVDPPDGSNIDGDKRSDSRTDVFVYENENYRPTSRSPVRHRTPLRMRSSESPAYNQSTVRNESAARNVSPVRTSVRSSVKRTDTFKVERPQAEPSIRIEIKNSITPNQPGRMVPVGVAKPMPSQNVIQPLRSNRLQSPARVWNPQPTPQQQKPGRYQTCIRITSNNPVVKKEPTRVQITGNARSPLRYITPRKPDHAKKQTYFGDNIPREIHAPLKSRQYIQHPDVYSYSRISRPTSGLINRNDANSCAVTQAVPRRSRSPNKAPWR